MNRGEAYYQLYFHFVWGTLHRAPRITPEIEAPLRHFIGSKCRELGYHLLEYGNVEDHIHLLISLLPSTCAADVAKMLKGSSAHFINHGLNGGEPLYWQDSYAVLSLAERSLASVSAYIQNQRAHHASGRLIGALELQT